MCVCARRQPSPIAAPPDSPWSPVRVSPCPAVSAPGLPPNIVHTVLAAALAIPLAAAPACRIAFAALQLGVQRTAFRAPRHVVLYQHRVSPVDHARPALGREVEHTHAAVRIPSDGERGAEARAEREEAARSMWLEWPRHINSRV